MGIAFALLLAVSGHPAFAQPEQIYSSSNASALARSALDKSVRNVVSLELNHGRITRLADGTLRIDQGNGHLDLSFTPQNRLSAASLTVGYLPPLS
jgi:hypothetical protein